MATQQKQINNFSASWGRTLQTWTLDSGLNYGPYDGPEVSAAAVPDKEDGYDHVTIEQILEWNITFYGVYQKWPKWILPFAGCVDSATAVRIESMRHSGLAVVEVGIRTVQ